jgi:hypothetical protein
LTIPGFNRAQAYEQLDTSSHSSRRADSDSSGSSQPAAQARNLSEHALQSGLLGESRSEAAIAWANNLHNLGKFQVPALQLDLTDGMPTYNMETVSKREVSSLFKNEVKTEFETEQRQALKQVGQHVATYAQLVVEAGQYTVKGDVFKVPGYRKDS